MFDAGCLPVKASNANVENLPVRGGSQVQTRDSSFQERAN
jgi:hypothetical protein